MAMKKYCYVIVSTDGNEHWTRVVARNSEEITEANWDGDNLQQLLLAGWRPVRETPMSGSDAGYGFSLLLLEKD
jgi:hypothetical protein